MDTRRVRTAQDLAERQSIVCGGGFSPKFERHVWDLAICAPILNKVVLMRARCLSISEPPLVLVTEGPVFHDRYPLS